MREYDGQGRASGYSRERECNQNSRPGQQQQQQAASKREGASARQERAADETTFEPSHDYSPASPLLG